MIYSGSGFLYCGHLLLKGQVNGPKVEQVKRYYYSPSPTRCGNLTEALKVRVSLSFLRLSLVIINNHVDMLAVEYM